MKIVFTLELMYLYLGESSENVSLWDRDAAGSFCKMDCVLFRSLICLVVRCLQSYGENEKLIEQQCLALGPRQVPKQTFPYAGKASFLSRKFVYTTRLKIDRFMVTSPPKDFLLNSSPPGCHQLFGVKNDVFLVSNWLVASIYTAYVYLEFGPSSQRFQFHEWDGLLK